MSNKNPWAKLNATLFFSKDAARSLLWKLRGKGSRRHTALEYARKHARAGDPASVLACLDEFGRNQRFLMNVGDEKGPVLLEQVAAAGPEPRILELGGYVGYSAILMGSSLQGAGHLVSLEKDPVSVEIASQMIELAGLADRVEVRCGDSQELIPELEGVFDLVFLDHWKNLYKRDLQLLEQHQRLRPGTIIFADNVGPIFNPEEYLHYVRNSEQYATRYVSGHVEYSRIEDGVEISVFRGEAAN
jgi:catechol O-methyltransferase